MKKQTLISLLLLTAAIASAQPGPAPIRSLQAQNYPGHTEITWKNKQAFTYHIYRKADGEQQFVKLAETNTDHYLDFYGRNFRPGTPIAYRILPKGMNPNATEAQHFEIKTNRIDYTDDTILDMVQQYTTRYFVDFAEPFTGMARERNNDTNGDIVTTGGTGFGLMAIVAAMQRNYLTRNKGLQQIHKIVNFLENAERFHGAWAHWYDADTRQPFNFSPYDDGGDLVETALLMQGLLTTRQYLRQADEPLARIIANKITTLWETVEWNHYTQGTDSLYWHWSKKHAWKMNHRIKGFDETLITYVLAAASPTYPIQPKVYEACFKKSPYYINGKNYYGITLDLGMPLGGPLFFAHYSFLGLDPRQLADKHTQYFRRNKAHTLIHRAYAIQNPKKHIGYGKNLWGFTSSDDPVRGYSSHHPGTDDDNGTVSPTAAIASIVYTPNESIELIKHLYFDLGKTLFGTYGFYDAYNPGLPAGQQVVKSYLAIDQGPIAVMIENYRSGLLWQLFMSNPEISPALSKLGFTQW